MGKQINYYMEYESFLRLAENALSLGCEIIWDTHADSIVRGCSLDVVTPDVIRYYLRVPEAGDITVGTDLNGRQYVDTAPASVSCLIEAGFSKIWHEEKHIGRNRLYCSTGYYDAGGTFIDRPECVTKVYNALARYVKKIAPLTETLEMRISIADETYLQEVEHRSKQYLTAYCLQLQQAGYALR
ncbi:MAG: hypothetical protein K5695_09265 [Oscillospiraceae bacterium]|nr:hypothetical protein [Oscillospiraceae bacterium]